MRLERLHRYAPRSEKLTERIFNEAEQAAAESEETDDVEAAPIADTGLPDAEKPEPKKRGRKPLPEDLPRERIEHDLRLEDHKACPCCRNRMHRMGETAQYEQLHIEGDGDGVASMCGSGNHACRHSRAHRAAHADRDRADAGTALAGQRRHAIHARARARQQICRRHPLASFGAGAGARKCQHQPRCPGQLGDPVGRSAFAAASYEALKQKLRSQPLVHGDETWVQVLKEDGRGAQAKSFMWAYRSGAGTASSRLSCSTISPGAASSIRRPFWATTAAC